MSVSRSPRSATAHALRQSGLVNLADLARAEELAEERQIGIERATVELGLLSEDQVLYLVGQTHGVEVVFPSAANVDRDLVARFPLELLRTHAAIPLIVEADEAVVAFAEVPEPGVLAEFARHAGMPVRAVLASARRLQSTLDKTFGAGVVDAAPASALDVAGMKAFYSRLAAAFVAGSDELRFEPSASETRVRVRRDGALVDEASEPANLLAGIAARARLLANLPASSAPQTADLVAQIGGREVALRLAIVPSCNGELVVLSRRSVLPAGLTLADFGLAPELLDWLRGPFCAPAGGVDAATGLVLVAATDPQLTSAFARAVLSGVDGATAVAVVSGDQRLDAERAVRVAPLADGLASTIRAVRSSHPDVLVVDAGETTDGLSAALQVALDGGRVVYCVTDPQPTHAVLTLLESGTAAGRLQRSLAAVVLLDHCRALCTRCASPDSRPEGWDGARVAVGCERCDGGFDGVAIVAAGARAASGTALSSSQLARRHPARLRELVAAGRVAKADARLRIPSMERR